MRKLKGDNLKEVMSKNDGEIHINDMIHWANDHGYHVIENGLVFNDKCESSDEVAFDSYIVQDVSGEEDREASDAVILCLDSNAIVRSHTFLN